MKNLIKQILKESKNQKIIDYIKSKKFSGVKDVLIFLKNAGFNVGEIKEIISHLFKDQKNFDQEIPNIVGMTEVIDNWGNTEVTKKKSDIVRILTNPDEWTDDQTIWDNHGYSYFWDDLINQFVIVGNELIYVQE